MPSGGAFGDKGPAILSDGDLVLLLAFMRWRFVQAAMDAQVSTAEEVSSGGTSRSYEVGLVQGLPWPGDQLGPSVRAKIAKATNELIRICWLPDLIDERSRSFVTPWVEGVTTIEALLEQRTQCREDRALAALALTDEIESLFADELKIDEAGLAYLDDEVTRLPTRYADTDLADSGTLSRLLELPIAAAISEMTAAAGGSRTITRLFYFYDRRIEVLSHFFRCHPSVIVRNRRANGIVERGALESTAFDILSWLVGLAFGRWDATANSAGTAFNPFSPVSLSSPGMLVGRDGGLPTAGQPDYPIRIPPDGLLIDEPGHPLDIMKAVEDAAVVVGDDCAALLEDALRTLEARTLRSYLSQKFFRSHLRRYSTRGRQAPLYWQLTIPSGGWSAWLYAPRLGREMLYALVTLADHRLASAASRIQSLEEESDGSARQRAKAIDAERTLVAELREMRDEVARLAGLGWQPDLDDGLVLCAAPLARWFPRSTWRQLADHLGAIRRGDYPWATVHRFRDVL